jgi:hypothetical protein
MLVHMERLVNGRWVNAGSFPDTDVGGIDDFDITGFKPGTQIGEFSVPLRSYFQKNRRLTPLVLVANPGSEWHEKLNLIPDAVYRLTLARVIL